MSDLRSYQTVVTNDISEALREEFVRYTILGMEQSLKTFSVRLRLSSVAI